MKSKAILVFLLAIFAVFAVNLTSLVSATSGTLPVSINEVSVSGVDVSEPGIPQVSLDTGDTVPIRVQVTANEDVTDARVMVSLSGEDVDATTGKFDMIKGRTYSKLLSLKLPASLKVTPSDEFNLVVEIDSRDGEMRAEYTFTIQRESYNLEVLSVETAREVTAGANLAVNVVLKNLGSHELEDTFVVARIPALNVEKRVYFSDLTPSDGKGVYFDMDGNKILHIDTDKEDAAERTLFLQIPSDAKAGVYSLEVEASNSDSSAKTTKSIAIAGTEQKSEVLIAVSSKEIQSGETATYDLVIINSGDKIAVYEIVPESAQNLVISVDEPIVTVPGDSSKTVKIKVTAGEVMGTFNFAVNVNSQDKLVKRVNFSANVAKKSVTSNVMVLTVILAIVFVVLLIVLIVLLTRKPEKTEELGESYY